MPERSRGEMDFSLRELAGISEINPQKRAE
jgi:hypothetical protein